MNAEQFMSEENHMCNLGPKLFSEIFDLDVIRDLPDNEFTRQTIYWLSQYLVGNISEPLEDINKLDIIDQFIIYETWFDLIKSQQELKFLAKRLNRYHIGLKTLL